MSWDGRLISFLVEEDEEVAEPEKTRAQRWQERQERRERARQRLERKRQNEKDKQLALKILGSIKKLPSPKRVAGKAYRGAKTGLGAAGIVGGGLLGLVGGANKYLKDNR